MTITRSAQKDLLEKIRKTILKPRLRNVLPKMHTKQEFQIYKDLEYKIKQELLNKVELLDK